MNEEKDGEKLRKQINEFESGFPDGVYAIPPKDNRVLNTRALIAYCREKDLDVETVNEEIIKMFMTIPNIEEIVNNMDISKEEKEKFIAKAEVLEDASPYGVYAVSDDKGEPQLMIRAMYEYCKKVEKKPEELTKEERAQFLRYPSSNTED